MMIQKSRKASNPVRRAVKKLTEDEIKAMFAAMGPMPQKTSEGPLKSAAIEIENGQITARKDTIYGGVYDAHGGKNLRVVGYDANVGGIYLKGVGSDFTLEDSVGLSNILDSELLGREPG